MRCVARARRSSSAREEGKSVDNSRRMARDKIIAVIKMSINTHVEEKKGDEQFEISDSRSVDEIKAMIKANGLEPLMSEYVYV